MAVLAISPTAPADRSSKLLPQAGSDRPHLPEDGRSKHKLHTYLFADVMCEARAARVSENAFLCAVLELESTMSIQFVVSHSLHCRAESCLPFGI